MTLFTQTYNEKLSWVSLKIEWFLEKHWSNDKNEIIMLVFRKKDVRFLWLSVIVTILTRLSCEELKFFKKFRKSVALFF